MAASAINKDFPPARYTNDDHVHCSVIVNDDHIRCSVIVNQDHIHCSVIVMKSAEKFFHELKISSNNVQTNR